MNKKPIFHHCSTLYTISWILTIPLLINICTGCNLFSFWVSWLLFFLVLIISIIRLVHGFRQHCYKFSWGLIAQLVAGVAILLFFQLSFNKIITTPVSDPVTPTELKIKAPAIVDSINDAEKDSVKMANDHKKNRKLHDSPKNAK